jgi:tRNA (guanine-N7-)-methyltransferase
MSRLNQLPNVFDHETGIAKGWSADFFQKSGPLVVELACGTGEFVIELAKADRHRNYVGIDIKGARLWRAADAAILHDLRNVAFLRAPIQAITEYFNTEEVSEIWLTFPDPYVKKYNTNKRLTSTVYLHRYRQILGRDGLIHLKTDSGRLFDFTLRTLNREGCVIHQALDDLHSSHAGESRARIVTRYEQRFIVDDKKIKYICFSLPDK